MQACTRWRIGHAGDGVSRNYAARPEFKKMAKHSPAHPVERQLAELLVGDPNLIPVAATQLAPEHVTHTGLRRIIAELYAAQAAGTVPDLEVLRTRLSDRPDLFDAAQQLQLVGGQMQDRAEWLSRVLKTLDAMRSGWTEPR
jgi:DNA primase